MDFIGKFFSKVSRYGLRKAVIQSKEYLDNNYRLKRTKTRLGKISGEFPYPVAYKGFKLYYFNDNDYNELLYHAFGAKNLIEERNLLSLYLSAGMTVLDIGANAGFFSLAVSPLIGESGRVFAFEPSGSTYKKLEMNTSLNNLKNVIPIRKGAGAKRENLTLHYNPEQTGLSSVVVSGENYLSEEIEIISLDEFCSSANIIPDFIKIDTEGFEPAVIEGSAEILKKHSPIVYPEISYLYPDSSARTVEMLNSFGYYSVEEIGDINDIPAGTNFIFKKKV